MAPAVPRFAEFCQAPELPSDPLYRLEWTTLKLKAAENTRSVHASALGNAVIDFLSSEVPSHIRKINEKKHTLVAESFIGGAACSFKVRIYQKGDAAHLLEFQRRSGDSAAFVALFQEVVGFMDLRFAGVEAPRVPQVQGTPLPLPLDDFGADAGAGPLLDWAGCDLDPALQAEAVFALAEGHGEALPQLPALLPRLLGAESLGVAYPAARLLTRIVELHGAAGAQCALQQARLRVGLECPPLLRRELEGAMRAAAA